MRKYTELIKRYAVFLFGLAVMALAVAIMSKAALGISPVQSLCYVIYRRFPEHISLGTLIFCWNCTLLLLQIPLLRRNFRLVNLIQIPLSLFLGWMVDVFGGLLSAWSPEHIALRLTTTVLGVVILAFAIRVTVAAGTVMNPGEAFVAAIAQCSKQPFHRIKIVVDLSLITLAIVASLILFGRWRFDIIGIGTLIAATTTGPLVGLMNRLVQPVTDRLFGIQHQGKEEKS